MEVEQHASTASTEIGYQVVGARNRAEKFCYQNILKRAVKNGCLEGGHRSKARKLNNHAKNFSSTNAKPKSTHSKRIWDVDEENDIKGKSLTAEERDILAENGKGLTTQESVSKHLKNINEIRRPSQLANDKATEKNAEANANKNSVEVDDGLEKDRKKDYDSIKIDNLDDCRPNDAYIMVSRRQKRQPSLNGHCNGDRHMMLFENGKEPVKCKSVLSSFADGEYSTNTNITEAIRDACDCDLGQCFERCKDLIFGMSHSTCISISRREQSRSEIDAVGGVRETKKQNIPFKNGVIGSKYTHDWKEPGDNNLKRVRLKSVNSKSTVLNGNGNLSTSFSNIDQRNHCNEELDKNVLNLKSRGSNRRKATGTSEDAVFRNVNKTINDNTHCTEQKFINYNTTVNLTENNIAKTERSKSNSQINEVTACKSTHPSSLISTTDRDKVDGSTATSLRSSKNAGKNSKEDSKESCGTPSCTCNWVNCDAKLTDAMELKTHVKEMHVKTMAASDLFFCFWKGCKVYNKPSSSYNWLVKHVNTHVGIRPFQCVIEPCSLSFASHSALIRHVQSHFNERSKYYKKPKDPAKETVPSPGRADDTLSGSESTSSKESKRRKTTGMLMRRTRHLNTNLMNDDFDRDSMSYVKKKLFHLENNSEKLLKMNGLRSIVQPLGRRTLEDGSSQFLMVFHSNERCDKWYNGKDVVHNGLCQLPINQLPNQQQEELCKEVFGNAKKKHGRKFKQKVFA